MNTDAEYNWFDLFINNERSNTLDVNDGPHNEFLTEENVNKEEELKSHEKTEENKKIFNEKLNRKTDITYGEVILMCILIGLRHSLTWLAMLDILNLINKLFAEDAINLSKYKLFNVFPENKEWISYHIYCPKCSSYIGNRSNLNNVAACPSCELIINDVKEAPYFLTLNIKAQFKQLFENPSVNKHLQHRFSRQKINTNSIEDIYDGELYKFLSSPGNILHNKWNFSYVLNTDGCQTSNSSKVSAWPVYLKINELPQQIRNKYMILVGIWVNEGKPLMNTYLQPIVKELNAIATEGVQWIMNEEIIVSKIIALCSSVDSVARCTLLNMKQFNGLFGCTFCYHPTENVEGTRKYPIDENVPPLRSHDDIMKDMIATRFQDPTTGEVEIKEVKGVKGPSILMNLLHFNLSDGMTPESMHSVFLGVTVQYTNLILNNSNEPYYIGSPNYLSIIDSRLLSFKAPTIITRRPRSINTKNLWKASEWRSWLLNYSLLVLHGILPLQYLQHLSKLVAAIVILMSSSIEMEQLDRAHSLLVEFVVYFQKYFGKKEMTYNIHLLLHLTNSVRKLGPLHVHDAFCFENENRLLLKMKKSPKDVAVQVSKRFMFYRTLPSFCEHLKIGHRVAEFSEEFEDRIKFYVKQNEAILISGKNAIFNDKEQNLGFIGSCISYKKLIFKGIRYVTTFYAQNYKCNDSIIETYDGMKGVINNICFVTDNINNQDKTVIFFYKIKTKKKKIFNLEDIDHIKECTIQYDDLCACRPQDLKTHCIFMSVNNKHYICDIIKGSRGD